MGVERVRQSPAPESWPRPLTKSLNSPSRLGHLGGFLSEMWMFLSVFGGLEGCFPVLRAPQSPRKPLETP